LLELNLSQNVIGPISAACLFDYLISPTCPLERLILNSADVDDFECGNNKNVFPSHLFLINIIPFDKENFVKAIRQNRSLTELNLSSNLIGKAENLNTGYYLICKWKI
jgi:Ran GTPase-activating protein (RanGAP) involved in mRNA processing and transport